MILSKEKDWLDVDVDVDINVDVDVDVDVDVNVDVDVVPQLTWVRAGAHLAIKGYQVNLQAAYDSFMKMMLMIIMIMLIVMIIMKILWFLLQRIDL